MKHLTVGDFRNHTSTAVDLLPGPVVLTGPNGAGKTSLLEALAWCSTLRSHRASSAATLIRVGAEEAVVRCRLSTREREAVVELALRRSGRSRGRLNGSDLPRPRDVLGVLRTVLFAPEDLALVRGDPAGRRDFLDDLLVQLAPRVDGLRTDLDRVLRQRAALLRSLAGRGREDADARSTLEVWNGQLVSLGTELTLLRLRLLDDLAPLLRSAHEAVAGHGELQATYESAWLPPRAGDDGGLPDAGAVATSLRNALAARSREEQVRGVNLVGPQRDDAVLTLRGMPARTHSSHGEAWSTALAARLATAALLRAQGDDPVLLLDDVFAELDAARRARLAELCGRFDQVVASAAVLDDVPEALRGQVVEVAA